MKIHWCDISQRNVFQTSYGEILSTAETIDHVAQQYRRIKSADKIE